LDYSLSQITLQVYTFVLEPLSLKAECQSQQSGPRLNGKLHCIRPKFPAQCVPD